MLNLSKKIFYKKVVSIFLLAIGLSGCKKFIEIDPPTDRITEANVFNNDFTAAAVLNGIYTSISRDGLSTASATTPGLLTLSKLAALSADELNLWSGATVIETAFYTNALQTNYVGNTGAVAGEQFWNRAYVLIYECNQAIKGISESNSLSPSGKKQLLGEAKFLRAFLYFYLVNLYGDVPKVTGTYFEENRQVHRAPKSEIFNLIIEDLKEAETLLSISFLDANLKPVIDRVRPTKWAAVALLARVYLYTGENDKAEMKSTEVINQASLFDLTTVPLNSVFLKNSKEAIWQLQPVANGWNTIDARWFDLVSSPTGFSTTKSVSLSTSLYNSFEDGDDRKVKWVGSYSTGSPTVTYYYPWKYKAGSNPAINATNPGAISEYHMVLRIGEQYLIRAEARARLNNISGAVADLNVLRTRARATPSIAIPNPLPDLSSSLTQTQTIEAVMKERRVEMFTEWGHRWLDLKRTGTVDAVMTGYSAFKGGTWQTTDQLYPLPSGDLLLNPNLVQNPGYQ